MSALLANSGGSTETPSPSTEKRRRIIPYNFRRPDRISKEQVRSLYLLHDLFSHSLSSSMPIFLRTISEVTLVSVEQQAYVEYLYGLPDPTVIFTLSMHPLQGTAILEMNPAIAFPIIDRMLGGAGEQLAKARAVTEIEQKVLESFLKIVSDDLRDAWRPLVELDLQILGRETRPQLLQIVAPNEVVVAIVFHVQLGDIQGLMSLCIPAIVLEPIIARFNQSSYSRNRVVLPQQTHSLLSNLRTLPFQVAAELRGITATTDDLFRLAPGDILLLDQRADQPITVSVGGLEKFQGELVEQERRTAVYLHTAILPPNDEYEEGEFMESWTDAAAPGSSNSKRLPVVGLDLLGPGLKADGLMRRSD
ncbi:MAG: flagellar motor switch protein FliM [Acidobacteria bacterium]|nr:flagellar motor switch protein FliM [Acidobacteriota bacterium]